MRLRPAAFQAFISSLILTVLLFIVRHASSLTKTPGAFGLPRLLVPNLAIGSGQ